jgi:hypothetical protein
MAPGSSLAHRADDFGVTGVADEENVVAGAGVVLRFGVDLGHEGAGGVDEGHLAASGFGGDDFRNAVGGEDDGAIIRAFGEFLDEDGAHGFEAFHNVGVVDDLVPHEDGGAPFHQRLFHDLDRAIDAGAEAPGRGEEDGEGRF